MKIFLYFFLFFFILSCYAQEEQKKDTDISLSHTIDSLKIDKNTISILIDKSEFRLYVKSDKRIIKEYPVVFGKNPVDDKLMQGDRCTPEGTFHILSKYPHKEWSKFIWIDYPNKNSWKKHKDAKEAGRIPRDAQIGGEVGIHGVPKGMDFLIDTKYNWTLGCISLKNKDVDEIYPFITKNTLIEIRK